SRFYISRTVLSSRSILPSFFLLTPPPPRSPLFPYTTLFRSDFRPPLERGHESILGEIFGESDVTGDARQTCNESRRLDSLQVWRDRKSTRLNSSHVKISYAVFCLKKKKKIKKQ